MSKGTECMLAESRRFERGLSWRVGVMLGGGYGRAGVDLAGLHLRIGYGK